jgi:lipopolysaccharide transport system ATP-binding protein
MESLPGTDQDVVLSVRGVSKKFCRSLKKSLWYGVQDIAGELLGAARNDSELRPDEFWAVKDISFELWQGKCLGLIESNRSGISITLINSIV